jgi:DNA invertase Pin-like site-specific DNA recombinase
MIEYGYCRISTAKQSIERQIRNIRAEHPQAVIVQEVFTGTKTDGRKKFEALLKTVKPGDLIVFDSVSRMSRNAEEGFTVYQDLFSKGIELEFIKEPQINTTAFRNALKTAVPLTGTNVDYILEGINRFLLELAREQIRLSFEQSEKEVSDLHQRTREGIQTARLNGKQIGQKPGAKLVTKKSLKAKEEIKKYSRDFNGTLNDAECIRLLGIARNTYYRYKKDLKEILTDE